MKCLRTRAEQREEEVGGTDHGCGKECGFYPERQWEATGEFEVGR